MFLNITKNLLEYFWKFEEILNEKQLNLGKFRYVELLFKFYQNNEGNYFFDQKNFELVLKDIVSEELCIHDYKIIIQFLESFKNIRYIEGFVYFIHENHQNVAH